MLSSVRDRERISLEEFRFLIFTDQPMSYWKDGEKIPNVQPVPYSMQIFRHPDHVAVDAIARTMLVSPSAGAVNMYFASSNTPSGSGSDT